jgi:hypothetical protein
MTTPPQQLTIAELIAINERERAKLAAQYAKYVTAFAPAPQPTQPTRGK